MQNRKINKKGFVVIPIMIIAVAILGLGGYLLFREKVIAPKSQPQSTSAVGAVDETADWKTYRSEKYGFEIKYPSDWGSIETETEGPENLVTEANKDCRASGFIFRGNAAQEQVFGFLTHSVDYVGCNPGRGGSYFDTTSAEERDGKLLLNTISPEKIEKIVFTQSGSRAYIIKDTSWDKSEKDAFAVGFVNPPDSRFAVLVLQVTVAAAPTFEKREQILESILSSFKFTK